MNKTGERSNVPAPSSLKRNMPQFNVLNLGGAFLAYVIP